VFVIHFPTLFDDYMEEKTENPEVPEKMDERLKCKFCSKDFKDKITLMNHIRAYHQEENKKIIEFAVNPDVSLDDDKEYQEIMQEERGDLREEIKNARLEYSLERIKARTRDVKGEGKNEADKMFNLYEKLQEKFMEEIKNNRNEMKEMIENMEVPQEQKDGLSSLLENPEALMKLAQMFLGGEKKPPISESD